MKCKHEFIEIVEVYKRKDPIEVKDVYCQDCAVKFPKLKLMLQDRQNQAFEMLGNKSPVVFFDPNIKYIERKYRYYKEELNLLNLKVKIGKTNG